MYNSHDIVLKTSKNNIIITILVFEVQRDSKDSQNGNYVKYIICFTFIVNTNLVVKKVLNAKYFPAKSLPIYTRYIHTYIQTDTHTYLLKLNFFVSFFISK